MDQRRIPDHSGKFITLRDSSELRRTMCANEVQSSDAETVVDVPLPVVPKPPDASAAPIADVDQEPSDSMEVTRLREAVVPSSIAPDAEVAQIVEGAAGRVRSPFGNRLEQQVRGSEWRANGQIDCAETQRRFRLPRNLPPLEAEVIEGRFDVVRSPYWDPPVEIRVPPGRWVAGGEIACEQTGLPLRLPANLPIPAGTLVAGKPGVVRSPWGAQPEVAIRPEDWNPGQRCICTATGQFFILPETLVPLNAVPAEAPGVLTSPYAPEQRIVLAPHECVAGFRCECPATGKPLTVPAQFPVAWRFEGRVRQSRSPEAQSPFVTASESQSWQPVSVEDWSPGAVLCCVRTQREFVLPGVLPALEVAPAPNAPAVFSPFPPHRAVAVPIECWKPGARFTLNLPGGSCRVALPEGELPPVSALPANAPGQFVSPYAPGQTFGLPAWDCIRGRTITCPLSGERLILPAEFPESWQWTGEVRQAGVPEARSPFVREEEHAWMAISAADWTPGGRMRCRVTGGEFVLPVDLPALRVSAVPNPPGVLSPFVPHEPVPVEKSAWRRNATVTVQLPTGKPCRVILPADILPLGRAELDDLDALPLGLDPQIRSRRGAIRSPHGLKPWVEVPSRDWLPGMRLTCPATRRHFWLPAELPPLEARLGSRPGSVWSPYTDQAIDLPPDRWVPGETVRCPVTHGLIVLPPELPLLVANVDEKRPGTMESPFAPGDFFQIAPALWQPSAQLICPRTGRSFCLPAQLPEYIAEVEIEPLIGMVRSPYNERNTFRVRPEEWVAGGLVTCTNTGRRARLPGKLPPLRAALAEGRPGFILSPYVPHPAPRKIPAFAWRPGGLIECPETRRPLLLPDQLPPLLSASLGIRPWLVGLGIAAAIIVIATIWYFAAGAKP